MPKLQYFQYRLLHRIIGVNAFLHKIKISNSPLCSFCEVDPETIDHIFWTCPYVCTFWEKAIELCLKSQDKSFLNYFNVFFGYCDDIKHPINFFLLHAKYHIFWSKINKVNVDASVFYHKFNFHLKVKGFITRNMSPNPFVLYRDFFNYDI